MLIESWPFGFNRCPGSQRYLKRENDMRFMTMVKAAESFRQGPPPMALMEAVGALAGEAAKAGVLVDMGGLLPTAMGASLRLSEGKLSVIDGPFAETKEVVGGYAIFSVSSKEEAVAWAKRLMALHQQHMPDWDGEIEIRQLDGA